MHHFLLGPIAAWLLALAWLVKFLESAVGLRRVPNLLDPDQQPAPGTPLPSLTVIVPARDEAAAIGSCLESLLTQDYPTLHILAVDDRSTDATPALIDALAAAHPTRLTAIHIRELPAGWLGKSHAMALAAKQALAQNPAPDFLLFTDGDILFAPDILRRSLARAVAERADHFVTFPTTLSRTPGEAVLLGFLPVLGLFAVRPWCAANPRSRDAVGIGAFNLLRTSAYLGIGGFEALRMEIVEDLELARRVKRAGLRQRVAYAPGAVALHWAPGLIGILHGLTKNIFAVFRFNPALLLGAAIALGLLWIAPWICLLYPGTRLPGLVALASLAGLYILLAPRTLRPPWWFPTAPLAAALLIYSMLRSMLITLRDGGVTWRGTFYPLHSLRPKPTRNG